MASLIITTGQNAGVAFKLYRHPLVGGREANRDIQIMDPKVSRRHFVVRPAKDPAGDYEIIEQNAANGVYVNGKRIAGKATLADGNRILVGETQLVFVAGDDAAKIDAIKRMRQLSPASQAATVTD